MKFAEAELRLFKNKYVCRKCGHVVRSPPRKMTEGKVKCRHCKSYIFKPKRKK